MRKTILAAVYDTHGNPPDVLRVVEQPWPTPAADEVVVQMRAAPLNPADINSIEGWWSLAVRPLAWRSAIKSSCRITLEPGVKRAR